MVMERYFVKLVGTLTLQGLCPLLLRRNIPCLTVSTIKDIVFAQFRCITFKRHTKGIHPATEGRLFLKKSALRAACFQKSVRPKAY